MENYCGAGQARDDNMAHARCLLDKLNTYPDHQNTLSNQNQKPLSPYDQPPEAQKKHHK